MTSSILKNSDFVYIKQANAAVAPQLDFVDIPSKYRKLLLIFENIVPSVNDAAFLMRVSDNNGSSFISTATYQSAGTVTQAVAAAGNLGGLADASAILTRISGGWGVSNVASNGGYNGNMMIHGVNQTGAYKLANLNAACTNNNATEFFNINSSYTFRGTTNPINALRFYFNSGNITSGRISLYGITN